MLKSGKRETGEMRFNGSQWFQVSADPVFDADGRIVRAVHIIRDVTESNALKTEAARKAHLTALGELAAGVAHEINNPIMGIINCAQLIEDKKERGLPIGDLPRRVVREGERIARIVKNLLSFARSDTGSREPADPRDILQEALSLMLHVMEREGIRIDVRSAESLPMVMVHRQQIQQVFMNLLSNARHALNRKTPSRKNAKQITIHFGTVSVGPRRRMRVTISDNGPGIPASIRGRIFDPFFTTKPRGEGTGLGLSISERIVKDHGGSLTLESVEGRYTRAIVDFPL
jgi:signal transduction histidine kinase